MIKLAVLLTLLWLSVSICPYQCEGCLSNSIYECTSCSGGALYLWSCRNYTQSGVFIALCVLVMIFYIPTLILGIGVYRDAFLNIQLASLITWGYGAQSGAEMLQGTNFAIVTDNSFPDVFGYQFVGIMTVLLIFWVLVLSVQKIPHDPTAAIIRRKKIIFPVRLLTYFTVILAYSALCQVTTIQQEFVIFGFILAALALLKLLAFFVWLGLVSNSDSFQADNQAFYVLAQQLTSRRWYARYNLLFSLVSKTFILIAFTLFYRTPFQSGIAMLTLNFIYILYSGLTLRFLKTRYMVGNFLSNVVFEGVLVCSFGCGISDLGSSQWHSFKDGYFSLAIFLCVWLLVLQCIEIIVKRNILHRQIKSCWKRFIVCETTNDDVELGKFDEGSEREKVTMFRTNLLYKKEGGNGSLLKEIDQTKIQENQLGS